MELFLFNLYQLYFAWKKKNSPSLCYMPEWSPKNDNQGKHYTFYTAG